MKKHDILSSIFWLSIGLYVCFHAYYILRFGTFHTPGPGFIFFLTGAILSFLSIINLLTALSIKANEIKAPIKLWAGLKWQNIIIVNISLWAYMYFLDLLGFFLSAFLLMIFLFRIVEPMRWWITILTAFITVSASYIIFVILFKLPFPQGFIGM